jgi:hypothetical protein
MRPPCCLLICESPFPINFRMPEPIFMKFGMYTMTPEPAVFTSRSLATASNRGSSSATRVQVLSSQTPVQNSLSSNLVPCLEHLGTDHIESSSPTVVSGFVAAEMCLPRCCVATVAAQTTENTALLLLHHCCFRA